MQRRLGRGLGCALPSERRHVYSSYATRAESWCVCNSDGWTRTGGIPRAFFLLECREIKRCTIGQLVDSSFGESTLMPDSLSVIKR